MSAELKDSEVKIGSDSRQAKIDRVNQAWEKLWYDLKAHPALIDIFNKDPYSYSTEPSVKDRKKLTVADIQRIAEFLALPEVPEVLGDIHLNLCRCQLGDPEALALAMMLVANTKINSVYLLNNQIGDEGAIALVTALRTNPHLRNFSIDHNNFTDSAILKMAELLKGNQNLSYLAVSADIISVNAIDTLLRALEGTSIHHIHFKDFRAEENKVLLDLMHDIFRKNKALLDKQFQATLQKIQVFKQEQKSVLEGTLTRSESKQDNSHHSLEVNYQAIADELHALRTKGLLYDKGCYGVGDNRAEAELLLAFYASSNNHTPLPHKITVLEAFLRKRGPKAPKPQDKLAKEALSLLAVFHWKMAEELMRKTQQAQEIDQHLIAAFVAGSLGHNSPMMQDILKHALAFSKIRQPKDHLENGKNWKKLIQAECQRLDLNTTFFVLEKKTIEMLSKHPHLEQFFHEGTESICIQSPPFSGITYPPFQDEELVAMSEGICVTQRCHELTLSNHQMNDPQTQLFVGGLKHSPVRNLRLRLNQIGDEGGKACAAMLATNPQLVSLDLSYNQLGNAGVSALATALIDNRHLTQLSLENNPFGDEGFDAVAAMLLRNNTLTSVNVVSDTEKKPCSMAAVIRLIDALEKNHTITDFSCSFPKEISNHNALQLLNCIDKIRRRNVAANTVVKIKEKIKQLYLQVGSHEPQHLEKKGKKENTDPNKATLLEKSQEIKRLCQEAERFGYPKDAIRKFERSVDLACCLLEDTSIDEKTRKLETFVRVAVDPWFKQEVLTHLFFLHWDLVKNIIQKGGLEKRKLEKKEQPNQTNHESKETQVLDHSLVSAFVYGSLSQGSTVINGAHDALDLYVNPELTGKSVEELLTTLKQNKDQTKYNQVWQFYLAKCREFSLSPQFAAAEVKTTETAPPSAPTVLFSLEATALDASPLPSISQPQEQAPPSSTPLGQVSPSLKSPPSTKSP